MEQRRRAHPQSPGLSAYSLRQLPSRVLMRLPRSGCRHHAHPAVQTVPSAHQSPKLAAEERLRIMCTRICQRLRHVIAVGYRVGQRLRVPRDGPSTSDTERPRLVVADKMMHLQQGIPVLLVRTVRSAAASGAPGADPTVWCSVSSAPASCSDRSRSGSSTISSTGKVAWR